MDKKRMELLDEVDKILKTYDDESQQIILMYFSGKPIEEIVEYVYRDSIPVVEACPLANKELFLNTKKQYCLALIADCQKLMGKKLTEYINANF